ncbi:unnamed protein product, partial [Ectocarpus sp. 12 AP-2014]
RCSIQIYRVNGDNLIKSYFAQETTSRVAPTLQASDQQQQQIVPTATTMLRCISTRNNEVAPKCLPVAVWSCLRRHVDLSQAGGLEQKSTRLRQARTDAKWYTSTPSHL